MSEAQEKEMMVTKLHCHPTICPHAGLACIFLISRSKCSFQIFIYRAGKPQGFLVGQFDDVMFLIFNKVGKDSLQLARNGILDKQK